MKILSIAVLFSILVLSVGILESSFAHPHQGHVTVDDHSHGAQTEVIPLDATIGLEKTTLLFHAPSSNTLPWGYVEGTVANHVDGYPVIIQMYSDGEPAHFAQTDVDDQGNYEYQFRVRNVDGDTVTTLFEGDYSVVIFKVVYLYPNLDEF